MSSLPPSGDSAQPTHWHRRRRKRRSSSKREDPHLGPAAPPNHALDTVIEWLLAPLLAFAPFAYGSVEAWSQFIVFSLVALLAIVFGAKMLVARDVPFVHTWTYLPIVLYLAWVLLQLVPLPAHFVQMGSPNTIVLKTFLLSDLRNAADSLRRMTLSFYPEGARHDLRIVLAATVVFVVVVNTYRNPAQIRRLLITIITIGVAVALLAFAQDLTNATHIFWRDRHGRGHATAGPFMTYSHYGQFMNLTIGAGLGLLLVEIHRNLPRSDDPDVSPPKPVFHRSRRLAWLIAGLIILEVSTVFLSGSRGAVIGLLVALGVGTAVLSQTRGLEGRTWIAIPAALVLCAAVVLFGPSSIFDRFITLENPDVAHDRWQIVKDLSHEWKQFPLTGTGLGTHEVIYPMYDQSSHLETATHAENEYAQAMEETGIVGVTLIVMFALIVWSHAARATRNSDPPIRLAGIGLGVGLLAIEIHSFSDFGQHLPPNAILAAVVCGLLVGLSRQSHYQRWRNPSKHKSHSGSESPERQREHDRRMEPRPPSWWVLPLRAIAVASLALGCGWELLGAYNAWRAETHWIVALGMEQALAADNWDGSDKFYDDLRAQASAACDYAPRNVMYRYSLDAYRWHSITRVRDRDTNEIIASPATYSFARRICQDLQQARALCPTYSNAMLLTGEIEYFFLHEPVGADHIRTAYFLGRNNQAAAGMAARCDANEGKWEQSAQKFQHFLELAGSIHDVIKTYIYENHQPELALRLARGNIHHLQCVADALDATAPHLAARARDEAFNTLKVQAFHADASPDLLAQLAEQYIARGRYPLAIKAYRDAIARDFSNVDWHFALAKALAHEDDVSEAMRELRWCLRQNSRLTHVKNMLGELSLRTSGAGSTTSPATRPVDGNLSPATQPPVSGTVSPVINPPANQGVQ